MLFWPSIRTAGNVNSFVIGSKEKFETLYPLCVMVMLFFELMFKIFPLTVSSWLVVLCIETKGVWIITSGGSAFTYEIILESDAFPTELLAFISIKFCPSSNKTDEVKMSLDGLYKKLVCCNPFTKKEIWLAADTFNTFAETTSWLE